jgi:hypothetical protein
MWGCGRVEGGVWGLGGVVRGGMRVGRGSMGRPFDPRHPNAPRDQQEIPNHPTLSPIHVQTARLTPCPSAQRARPQTTPTALAPSLAPTLHLPHPASTQPAVHAFKQPKHAPAAKNVARTARVPPKTQNPPHLRSHSLPAWRGRGGVCVNRGHSGESADGVAPTACGRRRRFFGGG